MLSFGYKYLYCYTFINNLTIIPISTSIDFFAEEKVRLQLAGTPAHNNFDLLIGCTAVTNNLVMVTDNIKLPIILANSRKNKNGESTTYYTSLSQSIVLLIVRWV